MKFTVFGSSGFIGSRLCAHLKAQGHEVYAPRRGEQVARNHSLGHAIYCAGLTTDFRHRPFDTVAAHIIFLAELLQHTTFSSFLYLSSARVYLGAATTEEWADCRVNPSHPDDFYNLTKLMGEALCFASGRENVRAVRLSNVFGIAPDAENFLTQIVSEALRFGHITLRSSLDSKKDYISLRDTLELLPKIAVSGKHRIYNLASGINVTNHQLLDLMVKLTGCKVTVVPGAPVISFPRISIARISEEFAAPSSDALSDLSPQIQALRDSLL